MHTDHWRRLHGVGAIDEIEVDHRVALVSFTFTARLHTRLAANTAIGIDEEFVLIRNWHGQLKRKCEMENREWHMRECGMRNAECEFVNGERWMIS
jgi:hypothetical protein